MRLEDVASFKDLININIDILKGKIESPWMINNKQESLNNDIFELNKNGLIICQYEDEYITGLIQEYKLESFIEKIKENELNYKCVFLKNDNIIHSINTENNWHPTLLALVYPYLTIKITPYCYSNIIEVIILYEGKNIDLKIINECLLYANSIDNKENPFEPNKLRLPIGEAIRVGIFPK